jgi:hypothetical protein
MHTEKVDSLDDLAELTLGDSVEAGDLVVLILVILLEIYLVVDDDLAFVKEMTSSKRLPSHLKKHTSECKKK